MQDFSLSHCSEAADMLHEDIHEIVFLVSGTQDQIQHVMGQGAALIDGFCVGDLAPRLHDNNSGIARGTQEQHGLMFMYIGKIWQVYSVI